MKNLLITLCLLGLLLIPAAPVATAESSLQPQQTACVTYVVKPGDYLQRIATAYRTTVPAIKRKNGLFGDMIWTGQRLQVCEGAGPIAPPARVCTYTIVRGDNWYKIATRYGLNVYWLQNLNPNTQILAGNILDLCGSGK